MVKNSAIATVSITKEQESFCEEHNISLSAIIQSGINQQMDIWKRYHTEVGKLNESIERLIGLQQELFEFLGVKDLANEFASWRGEKHV